MCDFVHARNYVLKKNFIHRLRKLNCCRLALSFRPRLTLERYPNCRLFLQSKQSGNCRVRHTVTGCDQQRKQRDVTAWYAMDTGTNLLQRPKSLDGVFPRVHACAVHTQPGDTTHWLAFVRGVGGRLSGAGLVPTPNSKDLRSPCRCRRFQRPFVAPTQIFHPFMHLSVARRIFGWLSGRVIVAS